jgi:hypothetical protein
VYSTVARYRFDLSRRWQPAVPEEITTMLRVLISAVSACFCMSCPAVADPRIDSAIDEFSKVGADPQRLKIYCAMSNAVDTAEDKGNAVAAAAIGRYLKELGAEFEKAWHVADDVDETSADGKALSASIDELTGMCD